MIPKLRAPCARQRDWRVMIEAEDVVHLYCGLGPAQFLLGEWVDGSNDKALPDGEVNSIFRANTV